MMNFKIYVSLPIGGHEDSVKERFEKAVNEIYEQFGDDTYISAPVNIMDFDENGLTVERDHDWAYYMGMDLMELLRCDAIYMCKGYLLSPGCRTELAVARERDLKVVYAPDAKEFLTTKAKCKE